MVDFTPDFLLQNPAMVRPAAAWCVALDNIELGILLLTQPWLAGEGLGRADLERQLAELASDMPIGTVYFQRVNRAVADLERRGALRGTGSGRSRRFTLAPPGFAALILNLHVLRADPTLDGHEFELKRELVAMWNLLLDRLLASPPEIQIAPDVAHFFAEVDALSLWGRPVITPEVVRETFDILRLIQTQHDRVRLLKSAAENRLAETRAQAELLRTADLSQLDLGALGERVAILKDNPELLEMIRGLATSAMPQLAVQARIKRYDAYLTYLDGLTQTYAKELKVVDIDLFRRRVAGQGG